MENIDISKQNFILAVQFILSSIFYI